jgi:hypothetical protein
MYVILGLFAIRVLIIKQEGGEETASILKK